MSPQAQGLCVGTQPVHGDTGSTAWLELLGLSHSYQEELDKVPRSQGVRYSAAPIQSAHGGLGPAGMALQCREQPCPVLVLQGTASFPPQVWFPKHSSHALSTLCSQAKLDHVSCKPEIHLECPELIYAFIYMEEKKKK